MAIVCSWGLSITFRTLIWVKECSNLLLVIPSCWPWSSYCAFLLIGMLSQSPWDQFMPEILSFREIEVPRWWLLCGQDCSGGSGLHRVYCGWPSALRLPRTILNKEASHQWHPWTDSQRGLKCFTVIFDTSLHHLHYHEVSWKTSQFILEIIFFILNCHIRTSKEGYSQWFSA